MRDIQQVLERWGAWAAQNNTAISWSLVSPGFRGTLPVSPWGSPACSDDDGLIIDSCVCRLQSVRQAGEFDLLMLHYVCGIPKRILARWRRMDEKTVRIQLQFAEGFIEGCLSMLDVPLDTDPIVEIQAAEKSVVRSAKPVLV